MEEKETNIRHIMPKRPETTQEEITKFFQGRDPMERIVNIELGYDDSEAEIVFIDSNGVKKIKKEPFYPFAWAKNSACIRMCGGLKGNLRAKMREYGIEVKALYTCREEHPYTHEKLMRGYKYLFQAKRKMSMGKFQTFFNEIGTPLRAPKKESDDPESQEFMTVSPVEQFMIETGKRFFKGYENYDELNRMAFDLETEGLDPRRHHISQIGIRTNRGFEKIITVLGNTKEEKAKNEVAAIVEFLSIISQQIPDVIFGHNTENFDWDFIIKRFEIDTKIPFKDFSSKYLKGGIYKQTKPTSLKLGGEVETYYATVLKYFNIVDSLHAVRRAQATDSSFEKANLKYATKYLHLAKSNRVYVPGNIIDTTWLITDEKFAFNDNNGDWYEITDERPLEEGYVPKSGKYIVERYLLDDIWEADKVELTLHQTDFQLTKMMPCTFTRVATMGTATQWKLIMLAWAYENNMAVPTLEARHPFTGGLSRLLQTGVARRIVKNDFNSLYPSTQLTWKIESETDFCGIFLKMLDYVLGKREYFKGLKNKARFEAEEIFNQLKSFNGTEEEVKELELKRDKLLCEKVNYDNQQMVLKKLGNSQFGSLGAQNIFPWGSLRAAEKTTCIGRMMLRLMIYRFKTLGYDPIVGDSFKGDTPVYIKYKQTGLIDIRPISDLIDLKEIDIDKENRERDFSEKPYLILSRSGWNEIKYIYRHKTDKLMYQVSEVEGNNIEVTQDHSLFNSDKVKIKPTEIDSETELEHYSNEIIGDKLIDLSNNTKYVKEIAKMVANGDIIKIPVPIINCDAKSANIFINEYNNQKTKVTPSKTTMAIMQYLNKKTTKK